MHSLTLPDGRPRSLPTRWGEVTLGQSARLAELPESADTYSFLSVLLDLSPLEVMNLPHDFVNGQVLPVLEFVTTGELPLLADGPRPGTLDLPGADGLRAVPVPADLTLATFGQATDVGAVLQDATLPITEKRIQLLAILLYPAYHASAYDSDGVDTFAREVCVNVPLEQALPLTDFFLLSSTASGVPTTPSSSASPSAPTSGRPDSKPWWRSGTRWPWSTRSPRATKPAGPTSSV